MTDRNHFADAARTLAAPERRDGAKRRIIGRLVSLDGMHGVIACEIGRRDGPAKIGRWAT